MWVYILAHSKLAVIGGVLIIAIADEFSDALGIHISEESENKHAPRETWESTISAFFSKFLFASTFLLHILLFKLSTAIVISVIWGLLALSILSLNIAREQKKESWKVISEHLIIALVVITITHYVGDWISLTFG